ncbi:MAG: extracellular solute-binding protein [Oscillospiraceae bacterium]|jgi:ABC-type glycerol-3-phosphate transport system substrate-binding protein|nr:extracellular solute-binding protein [Oscillospiraceae bacterium]
MKKRLLWLSVLVVILLCVVLPLCFAGRYGDGVPDAAIRQVSVGAARWNIYQEADIVQAIPWQDITAAEGRACAGGLLLPPGSAAGIPLDLPEAGVYRLALRYTLPNPSVLDAVFTLQTEQGAACATLSVIWSDADTPYPADRYGNELNRGQSALDLFVSAAMKVQGSVGSEDILLFLPAGGSVLYIRPDTQEILLESVWVLREQSGGASDISGGAENGCLVMLEAENYTLKSDSFIRAKGVRDPALSPYDTYKRRMNTIDENSWKTAGQKILWTFEVPESGLYRAGFRYSQYSRPGKLSYRRLEIDGTLYAGTHSQIPFAPTRQDEYRNYIPDVCAAVYLEKGIHTLAMTSVLGPEEEVYHELTRILYTIADMGMDLKKLTAGNTDKNRTWNMDAYLPDIPGRLLQAADELEQCYSRLSLSSGIDPVYASDLIYAAGTLRKICGETRTLPNKVSLISEGDTSVSASIGNVLQELVETPLSLDRIYLTSGAVPPNDEVSFFTRAGESLRAFAHTFAEGAGQTGYAEDGNADSNELQVWAGMSMQHAEVLQQLIDQDYNMVNGTNIQLSIMPNAQKLVLANATGTGPDVVMGVPFYLPYDFAVRGAAKNLLEYEDFLEGYLRQYNLEGLLPLCYDGGVYGAVESVNFQVLYYRKDILDKLGLSIPDTWDDVVYMMPELLRHEMNFNVSLANNIGFKTFNTTGPFIYQNGGHFYANDGASSGFTQEATVRGFTQMTALFSAYSLSEYVANFFDAFRYGEVPIGVSGFDMYMRLSVAAPELQGLWDIALTPGQKTGGDILRYQSADSTACMIFSDSDKPYEAWAFLRWWLSDATQIRFSYLLENTYGTEYRWNTANLGAFSQLPYPEEHKAVILEQLGWQKENLRHPAGYMVERESSNVWNNVVANNKEMMASIDRAKIASDREIIRKLKEFGFLGKDGDLIRPYPIDTVERLIEEAGGS